MKCPWCKTSLDWSEAKRTRRRATFRCPHCKQTIQPDVKITNRRPPYGMSGEMTARWKKA